MELFDASIPERFWEKVQPLPETGCWLWLAALDRYGYGKFNLNGQTVQAHTVLVPPTGSNLLHWDHRCRIRCCVNPNHLELVTRYENQLRGLRDRGYRCVRVD